MVPCVTLFSSLMGIYTFFVLCPTAMDDSPPHTPVACK